MARKKENLQEKVVQIHEDLGGVNLNLSIRILSFQAVIPCSGFAVNQNSELWPVQVQECGR